MTGNARFSLGFDGRCEAAFRFYERCLGARIVNLLTYADSPATTGMPPDWAGKIMHGTLALGDIQITGSDVLEMQYEKPQGFSILLGIAEPADAERVFHALAENGEVTMAMAQTFWAVRFGTLVDQFGIPWAINCEQEPE